MGYPATLTSATAPPWSPLPPATAPTFLQAWHPLPSPAVSPARPGLIHKLPSWTCGLGVDLHSRLYAQWDTPGRHTGCKDAASLSSVYWVQLRTSLEHELVHRHSPGAGEFPLLLPSVDSLCQEFLRCTCKSFNLSKYSLSSLLLFSLGLAPFMVLRSKSVIQGTFLCFWSVIQTERMGPASLAAHSSASFLQRLLSLAGCCSCITFPSHRLMCATRVYLML